jgi:hypothetical protein
LPKNAFSGATVSVISECAAGVQPASPTPTPTRARSSWKKFCARPHSAVIADQNASETEIRPTRLDFGIVGVAGDGDAEERIEQREGEAGHQADLGVGEARGPA